MEDRAFNEVDLRRMLEHASGHRPDIVEGRRDAPPPRGHYGVSCGTDVMKQPYLEVTFRHGRPIAAYYYLPREANQRSVRSRRVEPGLVIDFAAEGQPIGIEITTPSKVSLAALNDVLQDLGQAPASSTDLAPVLAA
jgi:hypothetical protein